MGAPELSFSAGICELAGACPLVAGPDAPGAVAAGPLIVPLCWGWGAPELSYCFGVCCCAKATPALTSNAAPAKITNCFLIKRCPVFAPYRRFIGVRQRLAYRQVPEPPLGQNARIGWPNGRDAGPKVSNFTQTRVKGRTHSQPKGPVGSSFSIKSFSRSCAARRPSNPEQTCGRQSLIAASGYEKTRSDVRVGPASAQLADVGLARCQLQTMSCVETSNGKQDIYFGRLHFRRRGPFTWESSI